MSLAVKKVELTSRPDLDLYVRSVSCLEALEHTEKVRDLPPGKGTVASQLMQFVCNAAGESTFPTPDSAYEFMGTAKSGVVMKLMNEGRKFNELTDEAIEEEQKK